MTSKKSMYSTHKVTSTSMRTREWNENENPTPLQFDKFLPWICLQMNVLMLVTVERVIKEDSKLYGHRRVSSSRSRSIENIYASHQTYSSKFFDFTKFKVFEYSSYSSSSSSGANTINIKSYYNHHNQLIEVAIIDCPIRINRKVIQAINLCLPFHENFKKFVIRGAGLTDIVLYEIGKLLPHSNITDVCLDDTYVPEGNYYVLFERINQLQNISLCRCKINDEVCKMIAHNLDFQRPASITLKTIDLTSNSITNLGASYLGFMLRKNRSVLYLNLSDNIIGDTGASHILRSLMLFSLTEDENNELKWRRYKYAAEKIEEYKKCEKIIRDLMKFEKKKDNASTMLSASSKTEEKKCFKIIKPGQVRDLMKFEKNKDNASAMSSASSKTERQKRFKIIKPGQVPDINELLVEEQAEKMTIKNIGEFSDIFDNENVTYKNDKLYCIGNLKLCYLNLAYNDITYFSIKKLCEVLEYQSSISSFKYRGLLRVVIDGNNLPVGGELLETIQNYLKTAVKKCMRSPSRKNSRQRDSSQRVSYSEKTRHKSKENYTS